MKNQEYSTKKELVKKYRGRAHFIEDLEELEDDDLVAEINIVYKNGKEVSRDMYVPDDKWMTLEEYFKQSNS